MYFSIWEKRRDDFLSFVNSGAFDKRYGFQLIPAEGFDFRVSADLLLGLEEMASDDKTHKDLKRLTIIIDYLPFFADSNPEGYEQSSKNNRNAILGYPEVNFLFDESFSKREGPSYKYFLFRDPEQQAACVYESYHLFDSRTDDPFIAISNKYSNLYDGSNLRYALKREEYDVLKVTERNYKRIQDSRCQNLVICVEEERTQNRFNSYAAYANGCRVLPITTARGLSEINEQYGNGLIKGLKLIIRDFDLQFSDCDEENQKLRFDKEKKSPDENIVDYVRGAKDLAEKNDPEGRWRILEGLEHNVFWYNLNQVPRIFISKGVAHIYIVTSQEEYQVNRPDDREERSLFCKETTSKQVLRGFHKPVSGLYHSFQKIKILEKTYESVGWERMNSSSDGYFINTDRKDHDHGVPLDIYELTKGMIDRARRYFDQGKYVLASIVSQEAIEVLNGFHESLGLKAYHIYAISENAICMNILGGQENWLRDDSLFRIKKIQSDIMRLLAKKGKPEKDGLPANVLNQIYSDCRDFCYEKEHFLSEDAFVSAMGHLNDGLRYGELKQDIRERYRGLKSSRTKSTIHGYWDKAIDDIERLSDFKIVWSLLSLLLIFALVYGLLPFPLTQTWPWVILKSIAYIVTIGFTLLFLRSPMNAVFGMMGTSGSVKTFFRNFVIITLTFSFIYYFGFFQDARVTYDINQPHVCYNYDGTSSNKRIEELVFQRIDNGVQVRDTVYQVITVEYQPITFGQTWRNTVMTTLMQEPTDFFAIASTSNASMDREGLCLDRDKAATFHWLLIIQILISWIFFGVFISILYNKFRYES